MDWKYEDGRIYSIDEKGELMAETTFVLKENGEVDIDHSYVNSVLRGQGVAGKMLEVVAEYLREKGLKTTATCSYANTWLKGHKELYADIISKDVDDEAIACKIDGKH
ncbi:MAG: N-acetyltransferase [Clostridium lundense]|nr:N-acetyltransferase [Clostridium lundense]